MSELPNRRILVIDDNEGIRHDFGKILNGDGAATPALTGARSAFLGTAQEAPSLPSFQLTTAHQGAVGIELLERAVAVGEPFAVAFVDVRMPPGIDGVETISRLWEIQEDLQVVICTAFADYSFEEIIEKLGTSDNLLILKKPFEPVEVRQLASALTMKWTAMRRERERLEELREAEREAREAALSLSEANRALEEANDAAEAASRAKSEFLANMSHEIRTPMNALLGYLDLLVDGLEPTEEQAQHVQTIKRGGRHLLDVVNDILDLSRLEAGRLELSEQELAPAELLRDVAALFEHQAAEAGLALSLEVAPGVPERVRTDPLRVRQVLINLVGNAVKFTPAGSVTLRLQATPTDGDGHELRFEVVDTGPGIPREAIGSLFDAFTQFDNSTTRSVGGTGLGLTISEHLATALGGRIDVVSEVGRGSTFALVLETSPAGDTVRMAPGDRPGELAEGPLACRVLLVEDVPVNQVLIATFLRKAGAEVDLAENGELGSARALAERDAGRPYDLILMDMQMPVMDGYQATERIRAEGIAAPIVALTAHAMADDREKCLRAGCTEYFTKPIDRRLLIDKCRRLTTDAAPPALPAPRTAEAPAAEQGERRS